MIMTQVSTLSWLVRCAAAAGALLLGCALATARFGTGLQQPAVTTRDGSLVTLNRYVREPVPDIVLVGSSVTWRLKEQYFSRPRVRNLALAGGSPVTGLAIVAGQASLPRLILIETNILSREPDVALIARFVDAAQAEAQMLRPMRTAVAAFESWNHAAPDSVRASAERERLLSQPPSGFDNKVYLERAIAQMNAEDPTTAARANVARIRRLIDEIERRGVRALLIHIPFAPEIERSHLVRISKDVVAEAFPDRAMWLPLDPPMHELRWADGVHLDERSALLAVRAIERALDGAGDLHRP